MVFNTMFSFNFKISVPCTCTEQLSVFFISSMHLMSRLIFVESVLILSSLDLNIEPHEYKVFPGTELKIYNDTFFQAQNVVVNALDNVEARRYIDG